MAHLIDSNSDITFTGKTPWHGLGIDIPSDTPFETWCQTAFPWEYSEAEIYRGSPDRLDKFVKIRNYKAIVRSDTQIPLSIVGSRFKVVQPQQIMEFFRDLIDKDLYALETAGALLSGKRIWALAKYKGDPISVMGQDILLPYLLLTTSVDAKTCTTATHTTVRVVCNNTMHMALNGAVDAVRITHMQDFNPDSIKAQLGLMESKAEMFQTQANILAEHKLTDIEIVEFLYDTIGDKERNLADQPKSFYKIIELTRDQPGANLRSSQNTLWGVVNAVSHYTDHVAPERTRGNRLDKAWFGTNASLKNKVFQKALKVAA